MLLFEIEELGTNKDCVREILLSSLIFNKQFRNTRRNTRCMFYPPTPQIVKGGFKLQFGPFRVISKCHIFHCF